MLRLLAAPAIFAALLTTPAIDHSPGPVPAPKRPLKVPEIEVVATDYHFAAPATVAAGPTALRLVNRGKEVHHITLLRLEQGKTLADVQAALKQPGPPPAWVVMAGGPNGVSPGSSATAIVDLAPGRYLLSCFVPGPDGVPHVMKGMVRDLEVTATETKGAPEAAPAPDLMLHLADYGFTFLKPVTAGEHAVMVHNGGPQPHEVVFIRLDPGKKASDVVAWAEGGMKTPPPGTFEGGISPLAKDGKNTMLFNFRRGRYALICFLDDSHDGKPHFMHGMVQELTVQ